MRNNQEGSKLNFIKSLIGGIIVIMCIFAAFASAVSLTLYNGDFEDGSDDSSADYWTETSNVYYLPSEGDRYYDEVNLDGDATITDRAASFKSTGTAAIYQNISGVYTDSYDTYKISFDAGYRCDGNREGHIETFRVSLYNSVTGTEVAGENINIGEPWVDSSQTPNVDTIVSRRVILTVARSIQPHSQLQLRFSNTHSTSNPGYATAVLDNVSVSAYCCNATWGLNNSLVDPQGAHNGSALSGYSVAYGTGTAVTPCLYLSRTGTNRGVTVPYSSELSTESFTISAWAYVNSDNSSTELNVASSTTRSNSLYYGYRIYKTTGNKWAFWVGGGSTLSSTTFTGPTVTAGQWTFIVATFDKTGTQDADEVLGTMRLYIDGKYIGATTGVRFRKPASSDSPFLIGVHRLYPNAGYIAYFDGRIDDVRYYDHRLTSAEVANLYTAVIGYGNYGIPGYTFKVMTYNVKSFSYNLFSLGLIKNLVSTEDPDILCLQEVENEDGQLEELAVYLGMDYAFSNTTTSTFGNAILSKTPILTFNEYYLPQTVGEQIRVLQLCDIAVAGKIYTIANTHLTHNSAEFEGDTTLAEEARARQADAILNTVNYCKNPVILCGDFNSRGHWPAIDHLRQYFNTDTFDLTSNDSGNDSTKIDFIMVSHNTFDDQVNYAERIQDTTASDHMPIITIFEQQ